MDNFTGKDMKEEIQKYKQQINEAWSSWNNFPQAEQAPPSIVAWQNSSEGMKRNSTCLYGPQKRTMPRCYESLLKEFVLLFGVLFLSSLCFVSWSYMWNPRQLQYTFMPHRPIRDTTGCLQKLLWFWPLLSMAESILLRSDNSSLVPQIPSPRQAGFYTPGL